MDKTLRGYNNIDEMKEDEYREWRALTGYERLEEVTELSFELYGLKQATDDAQPRLQRTLVHLQRSQR